jgi:hypothetical protein
MAGHVMIVLTNAVPGADDEFNRCYDEQHLTDVLEKGPFKGARRYRIADADVGAEAPYRYLALYDVEDGKLEEAQDWILFSRAEREEALAAGREPLVPISPTLADERVAWFFEEISTRVAEEAPA